jgi:pimeloyl-ACP methyl ester carboxylesterase
MGMNRRAFMASVGSVAAVTFLERGARGAAPALDAGSFAQQPAGGDPNVGAFRDRANADGEFLLKARYWDASLRLEVGNRPYDVLVRQGKIANVAPATAPGKPDVRISGPATAWTSGFVARGLKVEGDSITHTAPYRGAILRLIALMREVNGAHDQQVATIKDVERQFDTAVGRYVYVRIQGVQYRVYYEEAGQGIPMVLQHTAGSDGRQWRHLLEDTEIQKRYRLIAYDLPFHGKSVPPTTIRWWEKEYRLTRDGVMDSIVAISRALKLDRPVYMGCSIGGYLAPDLALYHADDFRAVIGVNASIAGAQAPSQNPTGKADRQKPISERASPDPRYHPRINGESFGASMYEITSPEAPDPYRRETAWVYSQGGPGVFAGDLYYYNVDHDLVGKAQQIDTARTPVYLLSGEYDPSMQPGLRSADALAKQIPGATFQVIKGGSHFAMSDDYPRFRQYLVPILDKIANQRRQTNG